MPETTDLPTHGKQATERCWINKLTVGDGLLEFGVCGCVHVPTPYQSRSGARCLCCFGLVSEVQPSAATTSGCSITSPHVHVGSDPHGPSDDAAQETT